MSRNSQRHHLSVRGKYVNPFSENIVRNSVEIIAGHLLNLQQRHFLGFQITSRTFKSNLI